MNISRKNGGHLAAALLIPTILTSTAVASHQLLKTAFSGGVMDAAGGSFRLRATIGEAGVVGPTEGGSFVLGPGFWGGHYVLNHVVDAPLVEDSATENIIQYVNGLQQSTPNPFREITTIHYSVGRTSSVRLEIFDVGGRRVVTLKNEVQESGLYRVGWHGRDGGGSRVGSGVYFYRLDIGTWSNTKKLLKLQ